MSHFSAADAAPDVAALEAYLDRTAQSLTAMKRYIVGAHVAAGSRVVLDIGCGVGHDLELLARSGIAAIGIDPSAAFSAAARRRTADFRERVALVRARGEHLPFRDACADGCRIERVLQHATDPECVLLEALRCIQPAGLLTVFEPDWTTMRVVSECFDEDARWLTNVRHPDVGAELPELVERAGADVADIVEEHSVWHSLARAQIGINVEAAVARCVDEGSMRAADASEWLREQRNRDRDGVFRATMTKRLVVARVR
jgi:SAM-dependent methyltransferase